MLQLSGSVSNHMTPQVGNSTPGPMVRSLSQDAGALKRLYNIILRL